MSDIRNGFGARASKCKDWGYPLHYSVFACDLSMNELVMKEEAISEIVNLREDRELTIDDGSVDGRGASSARALGAQVSAQANEAVIV